jgi:hypothetical protein
MQTTMTPAEWSAIPGNPRQRNTEERARRAKHLLTPSLDQQAVKMAVLPDGRRFKVDGHTRDLFWQQHAELAPAELWVTVYHAADLAQVVELYDHCDNQAALETATDKVFGSFRELGFEPASGFMRVGAIAAALRLAFSIEMHVNAAHVDVHTLVAHWLPELKLLDEIAISATYFNGAITAAALLTLRRNRTAEFLYVVDENAPRRAGRPNERALAVKEFWERYARNDGEKAGLKLDAIEALRFLIDRHRETHHQKSTVQFLTSRAVACVERYLLKRSYTTHPNGKLIVKAIDLAGYFPAAAQMGAPPAVELRKRAAAADEAVLR